MDRRHIKYKQTNTGDSNDDYSDSNEDYNDETNETTAMMSREEGDDLGYDENDRDTSINAQPGTSPDPTSEEAPAGDQDIANVSPPGDSSGDAQTESPPDPSSEAVPAEEEDVSNVAEQLDHSPGYSGDVDAAADGESASRLEQEDNDANADREAREEEQMEETGASGGDGYLAEDDATSEELDDGSVGIEMRDVSIPVGRVDQPTSSAHQNGQDSPPPYGEPPSYDEVMKMQDKGRHEKGASSEDLEWDHDKEVRPTGLQHRDGQDADDAIELENVVIVPGSVADVERGTSHASVADTSFSTPASGMPQPVDASYQPSTEEISTSSWLPEVRFSEISPRTWLIYGVSVLVAICALLMVILLPLSFSYIEYYQYGMRKGRISEVVEFTKEVYDMGRYAIGPGKTFKRYPAWAHHVDYERIGVFTTDRIILEAHISFQYFIKQDELGLIEQKFDRSYEETIKSVAEAALKNKGATYSTEEYFAQRGKVEQGLHDAVRLKLGGDCCPSRDECIRLSSCHLCNKNQTLCNKGFHVDVRFFQLKQLFIPPELTAKQLNVQLIYEGNVEELHKQTYQLILKDTEQETEKILNEAAVITNNGTTHARLILKRSNATANAKRESAHSEGLQLLYNMLNIDNDEHKASIHWLRTLERHDRLVRGISFKEYIALMQGLGDDD